MKRGLASASFCLLVACGGTLVGVGDGGLEDASQDHPSDSPPQQQPPVHDAGREAQAEAAAPHGNGAACAAAGYHCATETGTQCPVGSYPSTPTTQDCPAGELCCKQ